MAHETFVPRKWFLVVPSDTVDQHCSALLADAAGSVKVSFVDGSTDTFAIAANQTIAGRFTRIWATPAPPVLHGALY